MMKKIKNGIARLFLLVFILLSSYIVTVNAAESVNPMTDKKISIENSRIVYVAGNPNNYPMEYYDSREKIFKGIMPDMLKKVSKITGFQFEYMDPKYDQEYLIKNLQVEMVSSLEKNRDEIEKYGLTLTDAIFLLPTKDGNKELYFAFTKVADVEIIDSVTNALKSINSFEREEIILLNTSGKVKNYHHKFLDFSIAIAFAIAIAFIFILIYFLYKYKRYLKTHIYEDVLTGYGNEKQLEKDYVTIISDENRCSYCIVNLGVENFIEIKEVQGFEESNSVLRAIAHILNTHIEQEEMFARVSEDYFILILQYISRQKLMEKLDKIYDEIQEVIKKTSKEYVVLTKSGIYFLAHNDRELREPIYYAIQARRHAEKNKLRFAIYDDMISQNSIISKELEQDVIMGLDRNEFLPYFQPKVHVDTLEIVGYESLVRWESIKWGLSFPGKFMPILEKNKLLSQMDFSSFNHICGIMGKRERNGDKPIYISCNFSRDSFYQADFCKNLKRIAWENQVPTIFLEIEITEDVTPENKEEIICKINELKAYGFSVALDNFGSGNSSFTSLKNCSIDYVKLDKELIEDIENPKTQLIVKGIVELCHSIEVKVVCNGIESKEQLQLLQELKCDVAQGYFFYQPMPYYEANKLL